MRLETLPMEGPFEEDRIHMLVTNRQTDRQTNRQTDRQTDRQTGRLIERQT